MADDLDDFRVSHCQDLPDNVRIIFKYVFTNRLPIQHPSPLIEVENEPLFDGDILTESDEEGSKIRFRRDYMKSLTNVPDENASLSSTNSNFLDYLCQPLFSSKHNKINNEGFKNGIDIYSEVHKLSRKNKITGYDTFSDFKIWYLRRLKVSNNKLKYQKTKKHKNKLTKLALDNEDLPKQRAIAKQRATIAKQLAFAKERAIAQQFTAIAKQLAIAVDDSDVRTIFETIRARHYMISQADFSEIVEPFITNRLNQPLYQEFVTSCDRIEKYRNTRREAYAENQRINNIIEADPTNIRLYGLRSGNVYKKRNYPNELRF